ncbi:hypothetical protein CFP56_019027 [Quercus suber]|uniref:Uncharacterized protein n=1 Tax=Quercus suber TaxID=58331 RepID=A0AAW0KLC4_QUESU
MTLLNFNINQSLVSYEVNLNHGHNVVVRIEPIGGTLDNGSGPCPTVECACQSNEYSTSFKKICNLAHTYPSDNQPPIYSCRGAMSRI